MVVQDGPNPHYVLEITSDRRETLGNHFILNLWFADHCLSSNISQNVSVVLMCAFPSSSNVASPAHAVLEGFIIPLFRTNASSNFGVAAIFS